MSKIIRRRVVHPTGSPFASSKAVVQQHMKDEADINRIVERARRGIAPSISRSEGAYVDMSNAPQDLTEAFARVEAAYDLFGHLPAKARDELGNDPRNLLKADAAFMLRHGLSVPRKDPSQSSAEGQEGSGGSAPVKPSKKASKGSRAPAPDQEDQD